MNYVDKLVAARINQIEHDIAWINEFIANEEKKLVDNKAARDLLIAELAELRGADVAVQG